MRRRYVRSLANSRHVLQFTDNAKFYENSTDDANIVVIAKAGSVIWRATPTPEWLRL